MQWVWDKLALYLNFHNSPTIQFEQTSRGITAHSKVGRGGGGVLDANHKLMAITTFGSSLTPALPNLLICQEWDITTGLFKSATPYYVAKDLRFRSTITKEYFYDNGDNKTQTYTALTKTASDISYGDNFRMGTDGTVTELQAVCPRYMTKAMLDAVNAPIYQALITVIDTGFATGVLDPSGNPVTRLEIAPDRQWEKFATT